MSQLIHQEMLVGITAFQRTSSLPAMVVAIGASLALRGARAAYVKFNHPLKGTIS
jgi:hypothetical protein